MTDSDVETLLGHDYRDPGYLSETVAFGSVSEPARTCRICHDEYPTETLFCPCRCRGSIQWVHTDCLNHWRAFTQNPAAKTNCLECHYRYHIIDRDNQPTICSRLVKYLSGHPVYFYIINQIVIIILTLLMQLIDHTGVIDRLFQTLLGRDIADKSKDIWNFTSKGDYVFVSLIMVGFWILTFILNLIFQIKKRWLYLTMFIKFSCERCVLLLLTATFMLGTLINPILGTILLTLILQLFLGIHYRFMDQLNSNQQQEIMAYSEAIDTEFRRTETDLRSDAQTDISPNPQSNMLTDYSSSDDII